MEEVRCFIAIELPEEIKKGLRELQAQLKAGSRAPVKWVDPENIHLTLKFLGNVSADRINEITKAMTEAVRGTPSFPLEIRELGVFPNPRRVQIVWVGLGGEVETLARLQQRIESGLEGLGFPAEGRRFTPHLTLARLRDRATPDERQKLGQLIADTGFDAARSFIADSVNLMKSQLTGEGPIYTRLSSAALDKTLPTAKA
ncbi:MAG TPA: RNA 2',3'-cyclic phosphodiesterase [Dehalococcoidales bacterium]|nr:RNA 2',3'-cyclic phosphodiesterase [Dehalococcoidales bacterium]